MGKKPVGPMPHFWYPNVSQKTSSYLERPRRDYLADACLGCGLTSDIPTRKDKHCGMTPQRTGENLRAFHAQSDAIAFNGGYRGLRYARKLRKLILRKPLKLAQYPHGLPDGDLDARPGHAELSAINSCGSHAE